MNTGMNLIKRQADDYFNRESTELISADLFLNDVKNYVLRYDDPSARIVFIERIIFLLRNKYDRHLLHCSLHESGSCRFVKFSESVLLYLQYELRKLENVLSSADFKLYERNDFNLTLKNIVDGMNIIGIDNLFDYRTFRKEIEEMNEFYFLNKKIWHQLLLGKLVEMAGNNVIEASVYSEIILSVSNAHPKSIVA